jgi:hypothetical protein
LFDIFCRSDIEELSVSKQPSALENTDKTITTHGLIFSHPEIKELFVLLINMSVFK